MDKTEKFIRDEMSNGEPGLPFDMDDLIAGTHSSIKRRANRRKALYSSPVVVILLLLGLTYFPANEDGSIFQGGELFIAGWEYSWTELQDLDIDESNGDLLYDQTVDYIFNESYYTYMDDSEELLDASDLEALIDYLEEV